MNNHKIKQCVNYLYYLCDDPKIDQTKILLCIDIIEKSTESESDCQKSKPNILKLSDSQSKSESNIPKYGSESESDDTKSDSDYKKSKPNDSKSNSNDSKSDSDDSKSGNIDAYYDCIKPKISESNSNKPYKMIYNNFKTESDDSDKHSYGDSGSDSDDKDNYGNSGDGYIYWTHYKDDYSDKHSDGDSGEDISSEGKGNSGDDYIYWSYYKNNDSDSDSDYIHWTKTNHESYGDTGSISSDVHHHKHKSKNSYSHQLKIKNKSETNSSNFIEKYQPNIKTDSNHSNAFSKFISNCDFEFEHI